jgi:hypothetical protein
MSTPDHEQLLALLQDFVNTSSWNEARRLVQESPELLTPQADELFGQVIEGYREDPEAVEYLSEMRGLLRRCREVGIETAFDEFAPLEPIKSMQAILEAAESDPELQATLEEMERQVMALPLMPGVDALLKAETPAEVLEATREHPSLLSDECDELLREYIQSAREMGQERMAQQVEERYRTLQEIRGLDLSPEQMDAIITRGAQIKAALEALPEDMRALLDGVSSPEAFDALVRAHPEMQEALDRAMAEQA